MGNGGGSHPTVAGCSIHPPIAKYYTPPLDILEQAGPHYIITPLYSAVPYSAVPYSALHRAHYSTAAITCQYP